MLQFTPRHDEPTQRPQQVTLIVARPTVELDEAIGRIDTVLVIVGAIATFLCLAVMAWLARFALAPVNRLATAIAKIREDNLAALVDPAATPSELVAIVERLNELLKR